MSSRRPVQGYPRPHHPCKSTPCDHPRRNRLGARTIRPGWRILVFAPSRNLTRRRTGLFQRVRTGEGVDRGERISDPGEIRKRRGVDREEFCSRRLAREADVGESDRVAVAIASGGGVFQVLFERGERGRVPMLAPFDAGGLIELEFVFQIFANARHDQGVFFARDTLRPVQGGGRAYLIPARRLELKGARRSFQCRACDPLAPAASSRRNSAS